MTTNEVELRALMTAGLNGDGAAYRMLLDRLSRHLRAYYKGKLARIGRSATEAEDLVQDALMAIHTRRHTYDPGQLFTPWAHAIARYKLIDHYRRRQVRAWAPIEDSEDLVAPDRADETMAARDVERLLDGLPSNQARAIRATRLEGASTQEAADETGLSPALVKVSVHRGLKTLMARIGGGDAP